MDRTIKETNRRRAIQQKYNDEHGITPQTIRKAVRDLIRISKAVPAKTSEKLDKDPESMSIDELKTTIAQVTKKMHQAAVELNFELAATLRDTMLDLKKHLQEAEQ